MRILSLLGASSQTGRSLRYIVANLVRSVARVKVRGLRVKMCTTQRKMGAYICLERCELSYGVKICRSWNDIDKVRELERKTIASGDTKEEPSGIRSFRLVFRALFLCQFLLYRWFKENSRNFLYMLDIWLNVS